MCAFYELKVAKIYLLIYTYIKSCLKGLYLWWRRLYPRSQSFCTLLLHILLQHYVFFPLQENLVAPSLLQITLFESYTFEYPMITLFVDFLWVIG